MGAVTSAALACAALLAAGPAKAQAPVASCPTPPSPPFIHGQVGAGAGSEEAQTFSLASDAIVQAAELQLRRLDVTATGDFIVQLFTADGTGPTGSPLATGTFPTASAPTTNPGVLATIGFSPPTLVPAGQLHAIVVSKNGTGAGGVRQRNDDACPGQRFFRGSPSGAWTVSPTADFAPFAVLGSPPAQAEPEPQAADTNPPTVTIASGPKDKTKKANATFTFNGADPTRAVASFQCSLDGGAFAPCTSPHTVRVKKGKHTFQVQAIDDSGNVGSPASDDWKRKKKRRR